MSKQIVVNSEVVALGNGAYRIDVKVDNAPVNLFGGGFDLNIKAAGVEANGFSLDSYSLGNVFSVDEHDGVASFSHLDSKNNSVVFGISMLRSNRYSVKDGVLASFVVTPSSKDGEMISVSFDRGFLSGFDGSMRFDFKDVVWKENAFVFSRSISSETKSSETKLDSVAAPESGGTKVVVSNAGVPLKNSDGLNGFVNSATLVDSSANSVSTVGSVSSGTSTAGPFDLLGKGYVIGDLYWFLGIMLFLSVLFFLSFRFSGRLARETSLID